MPRSRNRHNRRIRGPLSLPSKWTKKTLGVSNQGKNDYFNSCIRKAMEQIRSINPDAIREVDIRVEEIPLLIENWESNHVPLSAAQEASKAVSAQIVLYQRPIEYRSHNRRELAKLVHRTIVDQLSLIKGISIYDLGGEDFA